MSGGRVRSVGLRVGEIYSGCGGLVTQHGPRDQGSSILKILSVWGEDQRTLDFKGVDEHYDYYDSSEKRLLRSWI